MVKQGSNPRTYGSIMSGGGRRATGRPKEEEEDGQQLVSKLVVVGGDGGSATPPTTHQNLSWMPSPHSTSRSSRENLDLLLKSPSSLDTEGTEDSALLLVTAAAGECGGTGGGKTLEPSYTSRLARLCSRRRVVLLGLGVLVAAVYVVGRYYAHHHQHPTMMIPSVVTGGGGGENDFADNGDDDDGSTTIPAKRHTMAALSQLDPVVDLHLFAYDRPDGSKPPSALTASAYTVYPTNSWYQNLIMVNNDDGPQDIHRVYCIPYIVDAAGHIAGLRLHGVHRTVSNTVIQLNTQNEFGLTIGAVSTSTTTLSSSPDDNDNDNDQPQSLSRGYTIDTTTPLGVTLQWNAFPMKSSIVYGMPFGTVLYQDFGGSAPEAATYRPALYSEVPMTRAIVDGHETILQCDDDDDDDDLHVVVVEKELQLVFDRSDYTWLVVVSEPVHLKCRAVTHHYNDDVGGVEWTVLSYVNRPDVARTLVLRAALLNFCSTGLNPIHCGKTPTTNDFFSYGIGDAQYAQLLRSHADAFPGTDTDVAFTTNKITDQVELIFDWNVQSMSEIAASSSSFSGSKDKSSSVDDGDVDDEESKAPSGLITFAMMHHFDLIQEPLVMSGVSRYCVTSLVGPVCLYDGATWHLTYDVPPISFRAPRPPSVWSLPMIAESLRQDLQFRLPEFYQHGIGDTYFSGKMLAKLARILLVWEEVDEICNPTTPFASQAYITTCRGIHLPKRDAFEQALSALKSSVEVWFNGTAVTPFVYDPAWGGVASCGCSFDSDTQSCDNVFPNCDGFEDPGLNFGNAYYNDQHFHYGYFILASAVAARFDPEWGIANYEQVLLLIRCIANPSEEDVHFPTWRYKDFYRGNSWANGIATIYLNGKNQESSSEAIAAYEAIALYGQAMMSAWDHSASSVARERFNTASDIMKIGQVLTATELRSTRTYWHVQSQKNVYPDLYTPRAIGIMWQTMAQFQTWFGGAPYLAYGIQILPLTPISEFRDTVEWGKEMYPTFADSCMQAPSCEKDGWSILQYAMLATLGHNIGAANSTLNLKAPVFDSAGGNGHSLTNSLWFIATRPEIPPVPIKLPTHKEASATDTDSDKPQVEKVKDCGLPHVCTNGALDTKAGPYTCRERINWLMAERSQTQEDACIQVAREFLVECGACAPATPNECLPCSSDQCSNMSRCPIYGRTFVCLEGGARGGCSDAPWEISQNDWAPCKRCCELTHCMK